MASFGLGLLVLLLTTHPEPSKAQHCSHSWHPEGKQASSSLHDPQHTPGPPGELKGLPSLSEKKVLAGALSSTSSLGWRWGGQAAASVPF